MSVTLGQAEVIIEAAKKKSLELGTKMNIAIVDGGVNLIAFARMNLNHHAVPEVGATTSKYV